MYECLPATLQAYNLANIRTQVPTCTVPQRESRVTARIILKPIRDTHPLQSDGAARATEAAARRIRRGVQVLLIWNLINSVGNCSFPGDGNATGWRWKQTHSDQTTESVCETFNHEASTNHQPPSASSHTLRPLTSQPTHQPTLSST